MNKGRIPDRKKIHLALGRKINGMEREKKSSYGTISESKFGMQA